ncbi:hypothetical protein FOA52_001553 [Chlamydomonas sp. UWO 241]|nr:hypothetical protein FOA52_001553 [Chlamydomonas sp. UWO 241]
MAWGSKGAGVPLDDLCARLRKNDPGLSSLTILKHRKFDGGEVRKLVEAMAGNTSLTELYASMHAVGPEAAAALSELLASNGSLTSLCVGDSTFGDAGLKALAPGLKASASLRSLDLENKSMTLVGARTLAEVLADSDSLTALNISRNRLGDDGAAALASRPWRGLQQLDLRECELGRAAATALAGPPGTPEPGPSCLVRLDLSGNALGPGAGDGLGDLLSKFASLRELLLRGCELGDSGVSGVAGALGAHTCLRHLDLRDNALGGDGVAGALSAALGASTSLVHLDLGGNPGVGAAAVGALARALAGAERSALSHLDVTGACLSGDDGVAALQELSGAGALRTLCLLGTRLGDSGCAALLACLRAGGFAGLSELSVSGCELEWAGGLEPLLGALLAGEAPQLAVLECGANPACQADEVADVVLRLREARPGLQVHWNAADQANVAEGAAAGRAAEAP